VSITLLAPPLAIIADITGEDDGERKGSVMKQTLYRLQSRAGLSLASTAAGAASEDSGSVRADVLSRLVGRERDRHGDAERTHTMSALFNGITRTIGGLILRTPTAERDYLEEKTGQVALAFVGIIAETIGAILIIIR